MPKRLHPIDQARTAAGKIGEGILDLITTVPVTDEVESASPRDKANSIRRVASAMADATALTPSPPQSSP